MNTNSLKLNIYLIFLLFPVVYLASPTQVVIKQPVFKLSDFAFYYFAAQTFSIGNLESLYNLERLRSCFSDLFAITFNSILPVNYTPMGLVIFPIVSVAGLLPVHLAQSVFIALSSIILISGFTKLQSLASLNLDRVTKLKMAILILLTITGTPFIRAISLGQSSILFLGLYLYSLNQIIKSQTNQFSWQLAGLATISGIKPHYFFLISSLLLSQKRARELLFAVTFNCSYVVVLIVFEGPGWLIDYIKNSMLTHLKVIDYGLFGGNFPSDLLSAQSLLKAWFASNTSAFICVGIILIYFTFISLKVLLLNPSSMCSTLLMLPIFALFSPYFPIYDRLLIAPFFFWVLIQREIEISPPLSYSSILIYSLWLNLESLTSLL